MKRKYFKDLIRKIILENQPTITVKKVKSVGLDHLKKFKVFLSNGSIDYVYQKNAVIINSTQADYKCATISGLIKSELNYTYEFNGVNCDDYVWINSKSFKLII